MDKKVLNDKEMAILERNKQLAIIKSSNELLEYAKETVKNTDKITDELERSKNIKALDKAIEENKIKAQVHLNATMEEVENSTYGEASEAAKKKYEERLKKRGLTEEQVERTAIANVTFGEDSDKKSSKRKNIPKKYKAKAEENNDEIVRLEHEEELMHSMMATDEKILEKQKKNTKLADKELQKITDNIDSKKIKNEKISDKIITDSETNKDENVKSIKKSKFIKYKFDTSKIPENVQYDVVSLPSKGECYPIDSPLRCGRVPVAYITASDENIIASPMMYRDNKILDVLLERKVLLLDKEDIHKLVKGDRDAIILWLRATAYDNPNLPIFVTNPNNGKRYDITVNLGDFNYNKFNLEGDENGCFDFFTSNNDIIKFKYLTKYQEEALIDKLYDKTNNNESLNLLKYCRWMKESLSNNTSFEEADKTDIDGCITDIEDIVKDNVKDIVDDNIIIAETVTEQMIMNTYSINGNTDKNYIRSYIENLRSNNAYNYRKFIKENTPGVDFKLTVNIPESDGGGSFTTFFRITDTIFINI